MALPENLTRSRLLWIGALALVVALLLFQCTRKKDDAPAYQTAIVDRGEVVSRVSASGTLSATVTVEVGSQVSGRIQSLFADFNSVVSKGQRIAKIDPALFEAAVAQAAANVAAARGNLARAQAQTEESQRQAARATQLFAQALISENDRDNAVSTARANEGTVAQAQGQLAQAQASLQQAQTNLRYTDILAPTDGIVISRAVNVGQTVAASLSAPVIFTIAQDLRKMEVHTNVAESDIGKLRAGMESAFTVDAYPGERFIGRIREIRNAPQVVQNVVTYDAVIDVDNSALKLKPGMTATTTVIVDQRADVLRVPAVALRFRPEEPGAAKGAAGPAAMRAGGARTGAGMRSGDRGGNSSARTVYVLERGEPAPREIVTGLTDGSFTEVLSGQLAADEEVITGLAGAGNGSARGGMRGFRIL
jgi:HlyD family secretion protein